MNRREFIGQCAIAGIGMQQVSYLGAESTATPQKVDRSTGFDSRRPPVEKRTFTSPAVEELIEQIGSQMTDRKLAWQFANCFPNTLDTCVVFDHRRGKPDTYIITGDIDAMWLRDSCCQVQPYLPLCAKDAKLSEMIEGLIHRMASFILIDPYANAYQRDNTKKSPHQSDKTEMRRGVFEHKWELNSLIFPMRISTEYWKLTSRTEVFDDEWLRSMKAAVETMRRQQSPNYKKFYSFDRATNANEIAERAYDNNGRANGMIAAAFGTDDLTLFPYSVPENLFAAAILPRLADLLDALHDNSGLAADARSLAKEVHAAITQYGVIEHRHFGRMYAYEVDGFGSQFLADDANLPSLMGAPYLAEGSVEQDVYRNTRAFALSENNQFYFTSKAVPGLTGIGSPHNGGREMIWPLGLTGQGITAEDDATIVSCLHMLRDTDAGTGFMHEAFDKDNPADFTRPWFAWANSFFGEFVVKVAHERPRLLF